MLTLKWGGWGVGKREGDGWGVGWEVCGKTIPFSHIIIQ